MHALVNDRGHVIGQDHHRAKFSDHDCELIRGLRGHGLTYRQIVEKFDGEVSVTAVFQICNGHRRGQVAVGQKAK